VGLLDLIGSSSICLWAGTKSLDKFDDDPFDWESSGKFMKEFGSGRCFIVSKVSILVVTAAKISSSVTGLLRMKLHYLLRDKSNNKPLIYM
jgi:hypothetical protein